jgi:hypothetical protein
MFAPTSPQEIAMMNSAAIKRAEESRKAEAYRIMMDPDAGQDVTGRTGVAAGLFNPNQTMEAVDRNNATQIRGYEMSRDVGMDKNQKVYDADIYGSDRTFDGVQDTNEAGIRKQQISSMGDLLAKTSILAPGEQRVGIGSGTLNGAFGEYGDTNIAPAQNDIRSKDQVQANALQDAITRGETTAIAAATAGDNPYLVETVGEDGQPIFTAGNDAAGKEAFQNAGSQAKRAFTNYQSPTGVTVRATEDPNTGQVVDGDGNPIPSDWTRVDNVSTDAERVSSRASERDQRRIQYENTILMGSIDDGLELLEGMDAATGLAGTILGVKEDGAQVISELSSLMGVEVGEKDIPIEMLQGLASGSESYNGDRRTLNLIVLTVAYQAVKANDPTGPVSNIELSNQLKAMGAEGMLSNTEALKSTLRYQRTQAERRMASSPILVGQSAGPTPNPDPFMDAVTRGSAPDADLDEDMMRYMK